jgi:hypothetical protein
VIRTVLAVTAPVLAAGPKALTQSPTASAEEVVVWVSDKVVEEEVVILSFSVLTAGFFFDFFEEDVGLKVWLNTVPDSATVLPETETTFPDANVKLPPAKPRPPPAAAPPRVPLPGKLPLGGVPLAPPDRPAPVRPAPPAPNLPANPPPAAPPKPEAHVPDEVALLIVMDRAATVVLDFFDGVPVTVRQSPTATALSVCVAVSEKVVELVQLTVVCPSLALCTSIVVPLMEATLPLAPEPVGAVAASALTVVTTTRAALRAAIMAEAAPHRTRPRRCRLRFRTGGVRVDVSFMVVFVLLVVGITYSLRSASIGARCAARLAG